MKLQHLSASRIDTFYLCQMKYHAIYDLGIKDKSTHPMTRVGSAVHKVMERAVKVSKESMFPVDPTVYLEEELAKEDVSEHEELARKHVQTAVDWGYTDGLDSVIGVEVPFDLELEDGTHAVGYIDCLTRDAKTIRVIDLKTGKWIPSVGKTEKSWQARIYNIAARSLVPDAKFCVVSFWYLREKRIPVYKTQADANADTAKLIEVAAEIKAVTKPTCKKSRLCEWCPYRDQCPAFK